MARGPMLHVAVSRTGAGATVRIAGELDVATAPIVAHALGAFDGDATPTKVVIDVEHLTFVDASGLNPLLDAHRRLPPGTLRLHNVRPPVLRVLRLLDLAESFGLDGSVV